jgi:hypothetical protein
VICEGAAVSPAKLKNATQTSRLSRVKDHKSRRTILRLSPAFATFTRTPVYKSYVCHSYVFGALQVLYLPLLRNMGVGGVAALEFSNKKDRRLTPLCPAVTGAPVCKSFRPSSYVLTHLQALYAQQLHKTGGRILRILFTTSPGESQIYSTELRVPPRRDILPLSVPNSERRSH